MSNKVQYYSAVSPENNEPSVFMRTWDSEGVEHSDFVEGCKTIEASDKSAKKLQAKADKIAAEQKKKDGAKNLLDYLLSQFGFAGSEREALKFAKRYLSSAQLSNVINYGKTK